MRAQVAQEAMFVYGVVLLSVSLILLSFYYFDVADFKLLRRMDTCSFGKLMTCEDFTYDASSQNFTVRLRNSMEIPIYNLTLEITSPCKNAAWRMGEGAIIGLKPLEAANYNIHCPLTKGSHDVLMEVNFTTAQEPDIPKHKQGELKVKVA